MYVVLLVRNGHRFSTDRVKTSLSLVNTPCSSGVNSLHTSVLTSWPFYHLLTRPRPLGPPPGYLQFLVVILPDVLHLAVRAMIAVDGP
jgi:hypothetical protein